MPDSPLQSGRFFLKDTIRKQVDFRAVPQNRGLPPPPLQKPCPASLPRFSLPPQAVFHAHGNLCLSRAIASRRSRRQFSHLPLTLDELAWLLWATQGVRQKLGNECALRNVPSAGARHALETYLGVAHVDGLPAGLYRFLPFDWQLAQLSPDTNFGEQLAKACFDQGFVAQAAVTFAWTAIPARMEWRYGAAAHKVIAIDAGHLAQNLYLACESIGAGTCAIAAYDQQATDAVLGVDGEEEFAIYLAPVGKATTE